MPLNGAQSVIGEAPISSAYEHAAAADDFLSMREYAKAAEEYRRAAADYLACVDYSKDPGAQATLRHMHADQIRFAEAAERQAERDAAALNKAHNQRQLSRLAPPEYYLSPSEQQSPFQSPHSSTRRLQESVMSDKTSGSESYLFLGEEFTETGDRFNRFWAAVQTNLDKLTTQPMPVAFASVPLGDDIPDEETTTTSTTTKKVAVPEPLKPEPTRTTYPPTLEKSKYHHHHHGSKGRSGKGAVEPKVVDLDFGEDSSDSEWNLIPSSSRAPPPAGPTEKEKKLAEENERLKAEIEGMKGRMAEAEKFMKMRAGQEAQLRESIMLARREAQRTLLHSTTLRAPSAAYGSPSFLATTGGPPAPPPLLDLNNGMGMGASSPYMSPLPGQSSPTAVKDLEDQIKRLKADNAKLHAQNAKFREKWANLKESVKKRKQVKEQQNMADGLRAMTIQEDDEDAAMPGGAA